MKSDSRDPSHCGHDEENANNLSRWFGIDGIERHDFDYVVTWWELGQSLGSIEKVERFTA